MHNSIRTRLTVAFIGLAVGPLLLVGAILAWQSFTDQTQQTLDLQREVARRVGIQVTAFFEELENELLLVSKAQTLPELSRDEKQGILKLLMTQDVFDRLVLLDNRGQTQIHLSRLAHVSTEAGHYAEADAFIIPQSTGQIYYSPVQFEETTGEPLMTIAVPLLDIRTGLVDGVLISEVRLKKIENLITDIQVSPGQTVYIVDAQDKVVAHPNRSVVLRDTRFVVPRQDGIQPGLTGANASLPANVNILDQLILWLVKSFTGGDVVLAVDTVQVGQQEFNIVAEQTVSEALSLAIYMVAITAIIIAAALVISVTLGFLIVRQIVQPIQMMATTAQTISAGDLSQQVPITRQDELGILAGAFNDMTGQLRSIINDLEQEIAERKQAEADLRESEFFLRKSQSVAQIGSYYFDISTGEMTRSQVLDEIFGIDDNYPKGVEGWIGLIHPEHRDEMGQHLGQHVLVEHNRFDKEYRIIRYDNQQEGWVHGLGELEFDEDGKAIKMIGTIQDITERKQIEGKVHQLNAELEQRVIERTEQLEAAQGELLRQERLATLGKLTATVSHEIRNPLATIRASAFTIDRKTRKKNLDVEPALDRIQRNVTRCDNIIAELLDYTRMGASKLLPICFDDWLQNVLDEQAIPEGISLELALNSGIDISLDPERFRRVIINLVDNAYQAMLEYEARDDNTLVLGIKSDVVNQQLRLTIVDTGPGIAPEVMPHIFEPLYSTKGFGVGLGLSIVREIVKQHMGKIEITSEIGQGTQVTLWLPLSGQESDTPK